LNAYNVLYDASSPSAPTNLTAAPTAWQVIDLNYTDNSGNEIGFEIQRKSAGEADFSYLKSVDSNVTHYQDTTATAGVSQTYKVRSYNMAGLSSFTNAASTTIPDSAPAGPTNLTAPNPCPPPVVRLTWEDMANNDQYYHVERKSDSSPQWRVKANLGYNREYYDDLDIVEGETYYYRVRCSNPRGYSSYSNTITVEIIGLPKK
jgi:fibronectin type 3 domain-containing protein